LGTLIRDNENSIEISTKSRVESCSHAKQWSRKNYKIHIEREDARGKKQCIPMLVILVSRLCVLCTMYKKQTSIGMVTYFPVYVRIFQLENQKMDFDEIWYVRYVIGDYSRCVAYNFLRLIMIIMYRKQELCEVGANLATLSK
jgi:hypothetical protein